MKGDAIPVTNRLETLKPACALVMLIVVTTAWWYWRIPWGMMPSILPDSWVSLWAIQHCREFLSGRGELYHTTSIMSGGTDLFLHNVTEGIFIPLLFFGRGLSIESLYWIGCLVVLLLNGLTACLLCWEISNRIAVGLCCGFIAAVHPYVLAHLEAGHINLIPLFPLFLISWIGVIWLRGRRFRADILMLALLIAWGLFIDHYLFALILLLGGGGVGYLLISRQWSLARRVAVSYGLGCLGGSYKLIGVVQATRTHEFSGNHDPSLNGLDVLSLFVPGLFQMSRRLYTLPDYFSQAGYNWAESGGYVGIGLGLLLIMGLKNWRRCPQAAGCGVATVGLWYMALGPNIRFGGVPLGIPSPLELLPPVFPVPARFMGLGLVLSLATCSVLAEKRPRLVLCCLGVCLFEIWPTELPASSYPIDEGVTYMAAREPHEVVLDVGVSPQQSMYRQVYHGHRLFGGFLARTPRRYLHIMARNPFLQWAIHGEPQTRSVAEGFARLKVGLIYVNSSQVDVCSRLKDLSFLAVGYQGSESTVFIKALR